MAAEGHRVFDGSTLHITAWPRACGYLGRHLLRREIVETTLQSCGSRPAFETRPKSSRSRRPYAAGSRYCASSTFRQKSSQRVARGSLRRSDSFRKKSSGKRQTEFGGKVPRPPDRGPVPPTAGVKSPPPCLPTR
jgi:hypothetical protein